MCFLVIIVSILFCIFYNFLNGSFYSKFLQRSKQGKSMQVFLDLFKSEIRTNTELNLFFLSRFKAEKDLGFLRIGSLNARVKKTRESFNSFMGGSHQKTLNRYPPHYHPHHHQHQMMESQKIAVRSSAPQQQFKIDDNIKMHKSWGSADNIPINVSIFL